MENNGQQRNMGLGGHGRCFLIHGTEEEPDLPVAGDLERDN